MLQPPPASDQVQQFLSVKQFGNIREIDVQIIIDIDLDRRVKGILQNSVPGRLSAPRVPVQAIPEGLRPCHIVTYLKEIA